VKALPPPSGLLLPCCTIIFDSYFIHWIPAYGVETSTQLDLTVNCIRKDGETLGNPRGVDGYVEILYTAPTPTPDPTQEVTPSPEPQNMSIDILLGNSSSWGGTNHWLPNTGHPLWFRIKVTVGDLPEGVMLTGDSMFLDILPPLDDNFDSSETGSSNIHRNQGTCEYEIRGVDGDGGSPTILKVFELQSGMTNNGDWYRTVYSNPDDSVVIGKDGFVYHDYDGDIDKVSKNVFSIDVRPNTGTIRPGDDLRFRFGLLH
jgi:hypothetical protein